MLAIGVVGVMYWQSKGVAGLMTSPVLTVALLAGLCVVILLGALAIVRHADVLAHRLGEPSGTLLLTMAITGLEAAMVGLVMSTGQEKPTLARDTMFAVTMLVLNGFLGLALLLGGVRYREQPFNQQSAGAFLAMIVPLAVLGLVLPNYTRATAGPTLSVFQMVFMSVMSIGIYATFLFVQNKWHRDFFIARAAETTGEVSGLPGRPGEQDSHGGHGESSASTAYHIALLAVYGLAVILLAKKMSGPLDTVVAKLGAPVALGGFVMALLVLTPESIAAVKAARQNQLQRSVNILLGSVLASIGLTIPLVIIVSLVTGRRLVLGLEPAEMIMLALTLATTMITFSSPKTNRLQGSVHLLLFAASVMLVFDQ